MCPVNPEFLKNALNSTSVSADTHITVNVKGFKRVLDVTSIREMFALSMENIRWTQKTPDYTWDEFYPDRDSIGKLSLALPRIEWSHALLPHFLEAENIRKVYGIGNITIEKVPNENSLAAHKEKYGDKWQSYYYESDVYCFVDTFYNSQMTLTVGDTPKILTFRKFIADYREHGMTAEEFRQQYLGTLYEAIYIFAAFPEEAWKVIDSEKNSVTVGRYLLKQVKTGQYFIDEDNSTGNNNFMQRNIIVDIKRLGRQEVEAGKISD